MDGKRVEHSGRPSCAVRADVFDLTGDLLLIFGATFFSDAEAACDRALN